MNVAKVLPMAFVMIAGPQILTAIFLATGDAWRRTTPAYLAGGALSITLVASAAYVIGDGAGGESGSDRIDVIVLAVLAAAAVFTFLHRNRSTPPKWMGKLQDARPALAFKLGFLLLGVFPSDLLTSIAVGGFLANHGDPWWHVLPFVAVVLVLLAAPALAVLALGARGRALLPRIRDWMNSHSWVVSEIAIVFFMAMAIREIVA